MSDAIRRAVTRAAGSMHFLALYVLLYHLTCAVTPPLMGAPAPLPSRESRRARHAPFPAGKWNMVWGTGGWRARMTGGPAHGRWWCCHEGGNPYEGFWQWREGQLTVMESSDGWLSHITWSVYLDDALRGKIEWGTFTGTRVELSRE